MIKILIYLFAIYLGFLVLKAIIKSVLFSLVGVLVICLVAYFIFKMKKKND